MRLNIGWFLYYSSGLESEFSFFPPSYIMSIAVADYSAQAWLQGFNEVGVAIFNMSANELLAIRVGQVL